MNEINFLTLCQIFTISRSPYRESLLIVRIQVSFILHRLAVHLYLQLTMDFGHPKHVLQTQNCVFKDLIIDSSFLPCNNIEMRI